MTSIPGTGSELLVNASRLLMAGHYGYALREDFSLTIGTLDVYQRRLRVDLDQERETYEGSQRIAGNRTELRGQRC